MPSSPSGNTTTVTKSDPWSGQQPYLSGSPGDLSSGGVPGIYPYAQAAFLNSVPQYFPSDTYAGLTDQQKGLMSNLIGETSGGGTSGLQAADTNLASTLSPGYTAQTQGTFNQGTDVLNNELSSSYLNPENSPAYNTAISNAMAHAIPAATASFVNGNRGNSGLATAAATSAAANAAGGLAQQQFDVNQGIQNQAATQASSNLLNQQGNQYRALLAAPGIDQETLNNLSTGLNAAGMSQTDLQNQINANVAAYNYGQMLPWSQLGLYESAITGTGSPGGSSSASSPYFSNPTANLLSAGVGAAGLASAASNAGLFSSSTYAPLMSLFATAAAA